MKQSRVAIIILGGFLLVTLIGLTIAIALVLDGDNLESKSAGSEGGAVAEGVALENQGPTVALTPNTDHLPPVIRTQIHTVKEGETLYRISRFYGLTVADLIAANRLSDPDTLLAGQELLIPVEVVVMAAGNSTLAPPTAPAPTMRPSVAPNPTITPSPTETPPPTPVPNRIVNGLPLDAYLDMPPEVAANARAIIARGRASGRNPAAYSKVGDSTIENPHFMTRFDEADYNLGDYSHLQEVIEYYAGSHARQGMAVKRGFHSWTMNDPMWADKSVCLANETPLACEIRLHNPSIIFFRLGSNDRGVPAGYEQNLRQAVQYALDMDVLPILGTKADRFEGSDINNEMTRRVAADLQLPLWDFDAVAATIAGRGLQVDGVHLTVYYAHDYTSPTAFQRGHGLHNLTALQVLDVLWREIVQTSD